MHLIFPTESPDRFTCEATGIDPPHSAWAPECIEVPAAYVPLRFRRTSESKIVQHFSMGPVFGTRLVSSRFRELIEDFDPGVNAYVPVALELFPGEAVRGEYWLLKTRRAISAVMPPPANSFRAVRDADGTELGTAFDVDDVIFLEGDAFEGLHFWRDTAVQSGHFCSDAFRREIRKRRLEPILSEAQILHADDHHWLNEGRDL